MHIDNTNSNNLNAANRCLYGRKQIFTDEKVINAGNVCKVISDCFTTHLSNKSDIDYLYKYYKGNQPILYRTKERNSFVNNKIVENRANAIVTFHTGYRVGKPIKYIASVSDDNISDAVAKLNDMMRSIGKPTKDIQLVKWQLICGTAYRIVLPEDDKTATVPFKLYTLDPRNTFVIYSNDYAKEPVAGVTYSVDAHENITYSVYTKTEYFEVSGSTGSKLTKVDGNPLGRIPIIEYPANESRLGVIEIILPLLDALNTLDSNRLDSVEQFVQSLLVCYNCDFEDENTTAKTIREAGMVVLKSLGENRADIKVIAETLNQTETQMLKNDIIHAINEIAGVPSQGDGSSSDSSNNGAVVLKNGWQGTETRAQEFETMFGEPEQKLLELVAFICHSQSSIDFTAFDVEPKFTRRNYEDILSKSQTLVTMLNNDKIHPRCAYEASGLFVDVEEAYRLGMTWYDEQSAKASPEEAENDWGAMDVKGTLPDVEKGVSNGAKLATA